MEATRLDFLILDEKRKKSGPRRGKGNRVKTFYQDQGDPGLQIARGKVKKQERERTMGSNSSGGEEKTAPLVV